MGNWLFYINFEPVGVPVSLGYGGTDVKLDGFERGRESTRSTLMIQRC